MPESGRYLFMGRIGVQRGTDIEGVHYELVANIIDTDSVRAPREPVPLTLTAASMQA